MDEHKCGPDHDKVFFDEINAVFTRHPDAAKKYYVACMDHETDIMGIDFEKQAAVKKIEGDRIITEFVAINKLDELKGNGGLYCCSWWNDKCVSWWS